MRKLSQLGLLVALFFSISNTVNAGILVEPLVGYNFNAKVGDDSGTGAAVGGRLGYQNLGFQLGLDYLRSDLDIDGTDVTATEIGGFVGYQLPILFRVYAGYIFSAEGDYDGGKVTEGSGTKLGASFTGLPFLSLNVEYRTGSYDKVETNSGSTDQKTDFSALLLSVSLPLNL